MFGLTVRVTATRSKMLRTVPILAVLLFSGTMALPPVSPGAVSAQDGHSHHQRYRCDGRARPHRDQEEEALLRAKEEIAAQYYAAKISGTGTAEASAAVAEVTGVEVTPDAIQAILKTLFVSYQEQANDYYCGPASAWVVNNWNGDHFFGGDKDSYNEGWSLTQSNLASSTYLNTSIPGGTDFNSTRWRAALNTWLSGSSTWFYVLKWTPTYNEYVGALTTDIDTDHPFILDVHMPAGDDDIYLDGYDSGTWAHYITVRGYSSYGSETSYVDTYNNDDSGSLGPHNLFPSSDMVELIAERGMIW